MKKASEAKADTKRQMKSATPGKVGKDRHGLRTLEHKGEMPKGSMRAEAKGHSALDRKMSKC